MIFVDTSAWYAAAAETGDTAEACREILEQHADDLLTSDAVLAELWTLLSARGQAHLASPTVADVVASVTVLGVEPRDRRTAVEILRTWSDQAFSYTDALTFALIQREDVSTAVSLDRHFEVFRHGPQRRRRLRVLP